MGTIRAILWAAGAALCVSGAAVAQVRFDNGPLLTNPDICTVPPAGMISEVQLNDSTTGFLADAAYGARVADDFVIADVNGWTITGFSFYAYEVGAGPGGNQISGVNLRVWNGRPGDPGSTVIFGDPVTNWMSGSIFASIYRVTRSGIQCSTDRAVYRLTCTISPLNLPEGVYWLDWQIVSPSTLSGPWVPPVTISGLAGKPAANAIGLIDPQNFVWAQTIDAATAVPQDLAFQVLGTINGSGSTCYANCDHSTSQPFLNVNDFTCFLNKFATGDPYANCDGSTTPPVLNINDFVCFLNAFVTGCSAP